MDKSYKVAISIAAVIAALAVAYYFVIYLPQVQAAEVFATDGINCSSTQDTVVQQFETIQNIPNPTEESNHYSVQDGKCYVDVGGSAIDENGDQREAYIIYDGIERKEIAGCTWSTFAQFTIPISCLNNATTTSYSGSPAMMYERDFSPIEKEYMDKN